MGRRLSAIGADADADGSGRLGIAHSSGSPLAALPPSLAALCLFLPVPGPSAAAFWFHYACLLESLAHSPGVPTSFRPAPGHAEHFLFKPAVQPGLDNLFQIAGDIVDDLDIVSRQHGLHRLRNSAAHQRADPPFDKAKHLVYRAVVCKRRQLLDSGALPRIHEQNLAR